MAEKNQAATMAASSANYRYGKIDENSNIKYFVAPLKIQKKVGNRTLTYTYLNPTEEQLNAAGWYRIEYVYDDGTNEVIGNVLYIYVGKPDIEEEGEVE